MTIQTTADTVFPGNPAEVSTVETGKKDLAGWRLNRVAYVADCRCRSEDNLRISNARRTASGAWVHSPSSERPARVDNPGGGIHGAWRNNGAAAITRIIGGEMGITTSTEDGIDVVLVEHGGLGEIFATARPNPADDLASLLHRLRQVEQDSGGEILEMRIFGTVEDLASCTGLLREMYGSIDWPLTYVQGEDCIGGAVAGIQLHAVTGSAVSTLHRDGWPVGRVFEDDYARYCVLGNLHSSGPLRTRERQTRDTIAQLTGSLASAGMDIHSIVRTWFFIDNILGWYPAFNRVRSEIYSAEGVFDRYVPASTGIGGYNAHGAAVVASALAIRPKGESVTVRAIPSPLQCPAVDYGSSFSRAAEVVTPDCRLVFVSGTASINREGATSNLGDVDAQIEHTMEIVGAILKSRTMDFADVTRGNAYFRDPADAVKLEKLASRHGLPVSRVVVSHNDICRQDLLFELEIDAVRVEVPE